MLHFNLLISWLPDIVKKGFCTPAMDLTFQIKYVSTLYHVCSQRNHAKTAMHFLWTQCKHFTYLELYVQ